MGSKRANLPLRLLIVILEAFDSIYKLLYTIWYRLTAKARPARAAGSNPPSPTVIGIILAEPNAAAISLHRAASVAAWCLAYGSVQQVHLYEPSGHLKQSRALLEGCFAQLAQQQGRGITVQCGWITAPSNSSSSSSPDGEKQHHQQERASSNAGSQQSSQSTKPLAPATAGARDAAGGQGATSSSSSANVTSAAVVTVRLLSAEDAFLPVLDAVAQRCATLAAQSSSPTEAVAATADTKQQQQQQQQHGSMLPELAAVTGSSDLSTEPQLLLVFGPVLTLAGYPPYHTRAAEVQHMGSLAKASQQGVASAVAAYCKVLQRHGA